MRTHINRQHLFRTLCARFAFSLFVAAVVLASHLAHSKVLAEGVPTDREITRLYQQGQFEAVVGALDPLKDWSAHQSLYLGLSHLKSGNMKGTIRAWQHYVRIQKGSESGRKVSRYLSVLLQQESRRFAKARLEEEKGLSEKTDPNAIAVLPFQNLGAERYTPLSKGLAAMIITDLSKVKGLAVVERIQLQAVLNELKLVQSELVDKKNAPRLGKLLGAGKMTTGSFLDLDKGVMRLDASITRTESAQILAAPKAQGQLVAFYKVEKNLVFKILLALGRGPESLDSRTRIEVSKIHTKNFKAFQHYSEGLDLFDQGRYQESSRAFFRALEEDPNFGLARKGLLQTPIVPLTRAAMVAGGEKAGAIETTIPDLKVASVLAAVSSPASKTSTPQPVKAPAEESSPSAKLTQLSNASLPFVPIPLSTQQPINNGSGSPELVPVPVEIQIQLQE